MRTIVSIFCSGPSRFMRTIFAYVNIILSSEKNSSASNVSRELFIVH